MEQSIEYFKRPAVRALPVRDAIKERGPETGKTVNVSLNLSAKSFEFFLGCIALLLAVASVGFLSADYLTGYSSTVLHKLVKLFDLDLEINVPSFFSVLLLSTAAFLLAVITAISRKQGRRRLLEWTILSAGFLFLAFDEMASVHERLIEPMREILGVKTLGPLYYAWIVPAIALVVFLGIGFIKFLIELPAKTRWSFIIAGSMFVGGAVGIEALEGIYDQGNLIYNALVTIEESLEMGGIILFIWALLGYITNIQNSAAVTFTLASGPDKNSKNWMVNDLGLQS